MSGSAMSFLGKIKSAVMGNPVTRDYEVGKQVGSAGPGLLWKVHQAVKKSTKQVHVYVHRARDSSWSRAVSCIHVRSGESAIFTIFVYMYNTFY